MYALAKYYGVCVGQVLRRVCVGQVLRRIVGQLLRRMCWTSTKTYVLDKYQDVLLDK